MHRLLVPTVAALSLALTMPVLASTYPGIKIDAGRQGRVRAIQLAQVTPHDKNKGENAGAATPARKGSNAQRPQGQQVQQRQQQGPQRQQLQVPQPQQIQQRQQQQNQQWQQFQQRQQQGPQRQQLRVPQPQQIQQLQQQQNQRLQFQQRQQQQNLRWQQFQQRQQQQNQQRQQFQQRQLQQNQQRQQIQQRRQQPRRFDWSKYRPGQRPPDWQAHRNFDGQAWMRNYNAERRYRWQSYRRPSGWYYRRWVFGTILPMMFWTQQYWITDYWQFGLPNAPYGYVWVRYGNDALLVNVQTGYILQVRYGLFY